jgi:hypothetical protein
MPAGTTTTRTEVTELVTMLRRYVVQETVGPLKALGRTLAVGSASAVLLGIGGVLLLVALLRALQTETGSVFAGEFSWAPYFLTVIAGLAGLALAVAVIWHSVGTDRK